MSLGNDKVGVFSIKHGLTKRALDAGDSAAFSSIFPWPACTVTQCGTSVGQDRLASSFFCSQTLSTPTPAPVTQTVRRLLIHPLEKY